MTADGKYVRYTFFYNWNGLKKNRKIFKLFREGGGRGDCWKESFTNGTGNIIWREIINLVGNTVVGRGSPFQWEREIILNRTVIGRIYN